MTNEIHVDERGSLLLTYEAELDQYWVHFADWHDKAGTSSLAVARDWYELNSPEGHPIKLNGSQAVTVKAWAEKYL